MADTWSCAASVSTAVAAVWGDPVSSWVTSLIFAFPSAGRPRSLAKGSFSCGYDPLMICTASSSPCWTSVPALASVPVSERTEPMDTDWGDFEPEPVPADELHPMTSNNAVTVTAGAANADARRCFLMFSPIGWAQGPRRQSGDRRWRSPTPFAHTRLAAVGYSRSC